MTLARGTRRAMMWRMGRGALALGVVSCALSFGAPARAQDVRQCIQAHGQMQELFNTSKLTAARDAAATCEALACPKEIQSECTAFKTKVEAALPTITIVVRGVEPGASGFVEIDGEIALPRLEQKPLRIDPGKRVFRVELGDGRVAQTTLSIAAGETRTVELAVPPRAQPAAGELGPEPDASPDGSTFWDRVTTPAWIAGGVGVLGVLAGSYFGLRAISLKNDADEHCPSDDQCFKEGIRLRDDAQSAATISTVAFAVGIVGIGTAATLILIEPAPSGEGALFGMRGAF
jgi:hypothetical protein